MIIALGGALVLSLLLTTGYPDRMIEPGRLTDGHRKLDQDCFRCHEAFQGAAARSCRSCHPLAEIGRRDRSGKTLFHQGLADTDCMACHTLHLGERHRKTVRFQHALLAPSVQGECQTCHGDRKPGDSLHGALRSGCAACHSTESWRAVTFDHDRYFRFDSNHPSDCRGCHTDPARFQDYSCYGCHAHSAAEVAAEHREEGIRDFDDCARCHRSGQEEGHEGGGAGRGEREGEEEDED